ncbi:hypothetical protein HanRHA438_Chr14g0666961 [Helianthus annuus]|nr:hypothetical protein HanRHA438_Chr14g0666961 [Helianthus annuus]
MLKPITKNLWVIPDMVNTEIPRGKKKSRHKMIINWRNQKERTWTWVCLRVSHLAGYNMRYQ